MWPYVLISPAIQRNAQWISGRAAWGNILLFAHIRFGGNGENQSTAERRDRKQEQSVGKEVVGEESSVGIRTFLRQSIQE